MKKIIIFALSLFLFNSCGKMKESAFNEKVANEFLKEMNAADNLHEKYFSDNLMIAQTASSENSPEVKDAKQLVESSLSSMKNLRGIKVSPEAMPLYLATLEYLEKTKSFGNTCSAFFQQTNADYRKDYFETVQKEYAALNRKPDSILAVQKVYLKKVGIE